MILTVTLNAAIDKSLSGPSVRLGRRHRTVERRALAGGKGVQLLKLEDKERLTALATFDGQRLAVAGKTRLGRPASVVLSGEALERHRQHRARKGQALERIVRVEKLE